MAASVELRVPFVDHRLVEFSLTIPHKYQMKWKSKTDYEKAEYIMSHDISERLDTPKYLLKKAYEDTVPKENMYRHKVGFPVPFHNWMTGEILDSIKLLLLGDKARKRNLYNIPNIKKYLNDKTLQDHSGDSRTYQNSMAGKVWMLMNLEIFMQNHFD